MAEQQKLDIDDGSGDKEFFTIIPNYILNHSTSIDQSLYTQLKRLAGETKKDYCYPSIGYLMKQLKVGKERLKKSFKYLTGHKWITPLGKRRVMTRGGYQWVDMYKINNIWKLNMDFYKGESEQNALENEGGSGIAKGGSKSSKGGSGYSGITRTYKELKEERSSFKKKPYYRGDEMRFSQNKWWVLPPDGGDWLKFNDLESKIEWR